MLSGFQSLLVKSISFVDSLAHDESTNLINFAVESSTRNELRQFSRKGLKFGVKDEAYLSKKSIEIPNSAAIHSRVTDLYDSKNWL